MEIKIMEPLVLAKYIINRGLENNTPVNSLSLLWIMRIIATRYFKIYGERLVSRYAFDCPLGDTFVNLNVYLIYRGYGCSKIYDKTNLDVDPILKARIDAMSADLWEMDMITLKNMCETIDRKE